MTAMALVTVCVMLILSLIPAGIRGSKLSENHQVAMAWSRKLLGGAPTPKSYPVNPELALSHHQTEIGALKLSATRTVKQAGPYLHQVEVVTEWATGKTPLILSLTRFSPAGPKS